MLLSGPIAARTAADADELTLQVVVDKPTLYLGDSCLVTFVALSPHPFLSIDNFEERNIRLEHATLRRVPVRRRVQRLRTREGVVYRVEWARFVVTPTRQGRLRIPACKVGARLVRLDKFGRQEPFNAKGRSAKVEINVTLRPRPTTLELLQSGERVL